MRAPTERRYGPDGDQTFRAVGGDGRGTPPTSSAMWIVASDADERQGTDVAIALTRRVIDMDSDLKPAAQAVLIVLAFTANSEDGSGIYPRINTLVKQTHMGRATVNRALLELKNKGFMEVIRRGQRSAARRIVIPPAKSQSEPSRRLKVSLHEGSERAFLYERQKESTTVKQLDPSDLKLSARPQTSAPTPLYLPILHSVQKPSSTSVASEVQASGKDLKAREQFEARRVEVDAEQARERRRHRHRRRA